MSDTLQVPDEWRRAIERILSEPFDRVAVVGATDTGKSSFARALLAAAPRLALIDADPGQKLVGAPGTVSLGRPGPGGLELGGFVFIGSTSASNLFLIARACGALASASPRFVANTSGFVRKLGARLQAATIAALDADLVIAIGEEAAVGPILARHPGRPAIRLQPSPSAVRKTPSARAALRQASFAAALAGAESLELGGLGFEPAPPVPIELGGRHPVCSLAAADGTDMTLGIVEAAAGGRIRIHARRPGHRVAAIRLGRMWAEHRNGAWTLLDTLHPSWIHDEPEG